MRVDSAIAVPRGTRSHPAADGFIVGENGAVSRVHSAESQVVHGPAAGGRNRLLNSVAESLQQDINDPLRRLYVSRGYGRRKASVHHTPFGRMNSDRAEYTRTCRDCLGYERSKNIIDSRHGYGIDSVDASRYLRVGPLKVDLKALPVHAHADANFYGT